MCKIADYSSGCGDDFVVPEDPVAKCMGAKAKGSICNPISKGKTHVGVHCVKHDCLPCHAACLGYICGTCNQRVAPGNFQCLQRHKFRDSFFIVGLVSHPPHMRSEFSITEFFHIQQTTGLSGYPSAKEAVEFLNSVRLTLTESSREWCLKNQHIDSGSKPPIGNTAPGLLRFSAVPAQGFSIETASQRQNPIQPTNESPRPPTQLTGQPRRQ